MATTAELCTFFHGLRSFIRCHWDERIWRQFVLFHRLDFFLGESGLDNKRISDFYAQSDNNSVALLDQKAESRGLRHLLRCNSDGLMRISFTAPSSLNRRNTHWCLVGLLGVLWLSRLQRAGRRIPAICDLRMGIAFSLISFSRELGSGVFRVTN